MRGLTYAGGEIAAFMLAALLLGAAIGALIVSARRERGGKGTAEAVAAANVAKQRASEAEADDLRKRLGVAGDAIRELEAERSEGLGSSEEVEKLHAEIARLERLVDNRDRRIGELERRGTVDDAPPPPQPLPDDVEALTFRTTIANPVEAIVVFDDTASRRNDG